MRLLAPILAFGLVAVACGSATTADPTVASTQTEGQVSTTVTATSSDPVETTATAIATRQTEVRPLKLGRYDGGYVELIPSLAELSEPYAPMLLTTAEIEEILGRPFPTRNDDSFNTSTPSMRWCEIDELVEPGETTILTRTTWDELDYFLVAQSVHIAASEEDAQRFFAEYEQILRDPCRPSIGPVDYSDLESPNGAVRIRGVVPSTAEENDESNLFSEQRPDLQLGVATVASSKVESVITKGNITLTTEIFGYAFEFYTPEQADELLTFAEDLFLATVP